MTQARSAPILKLVSMQLPPAMNWMGQSLQPSDRENRLVLIPGQITDISIVVENLSNLPLQWQLKIGGNCPTAWWTAWWDESNRQEWEQGQTILGHDRFEGQVRFYVPTDFFEQQDAVHLENTQLELNYICEISLHTLVPGELGQLFGYQAIRIQVLPRSAYLDLLPDIYQTTDFTGRFLSIFEQAFDPTQQAIDAFWGYLDPLTAPAALLPFLSKWVAWQLDPRWTIRQQRRLLRNAIRLYRWCGTRWGLLIYLHLYTNLPLQEKEVPDALRINFELEEVDIPETEKQISVVEDHSAGFVLGAAELSNSPMLGGGRPYHFTVTLRSDPQHPIDEELIRCIIDQVKPAFCTYDLWLQSIDA